MRFSAKTLLKGVIGAAAVMGFALSPASAAEKKDFKVAWSIYVGWMPWGYAADSGIVKKWADKYGINIEVKQFNDYVESINQYTAGSFDAVTVTNMDALSIPAAGGVDTTAVIVGDFSNGNDAIILKNKDKLADIKGQNVNLVEFSVSHYLLARALPSVGLSEKDLKVVNTSDADMAAAYKTKDVTAVVTWKPIVSTILESPDAHKVFDSSQIPGEIMDLMVVNTNVLKDNPKFAKALVGIWYETLATMKDVFAAMLPYIERQLAEGTRLHSITRHFVGAFHGVPGARAFRRHLAENGVRTGAGIDVLRDAIALVDDRAHAAVAA